MTHPRTDPAPDRRAAVGRIDTALRWGEKLREIVATKGETHHIATGGDMKLLMDTIAMYYPWLEPVSETRRKAQGLEPRKGELPAFEGYLRGTIPHAHFWFRHQLSDKGIDHTVP